MTQAAFGFLMIVLSAFFQWKNRLPTIRVVMVIIGIFLVGFTGWLIHKIATLMLLLTGLLGSTLGTLTGIAGSTIFAGVIVFMCAHVLHDLLPKNRPGKSTYYVAALLAILIVAGVTPFAALNNLPATVQTGTSQVQGG
jgi:magnesium-transporting ATPase (P-type)